jgi:hypothetical protein
VLGAFVVTTGALVGATILMGLAVAAVGVPFWRAMLYAASLGALGGGFNGDSIDAIFWYRPGRGADYLWFAD